MHRQSVSFRLSIGEPDRGIPFIGAKRQGKRMSENGRCLFLLLARGDEILGLLLVLLYCCCPFRLEAADQSRDLVARLQPVKGQVYVLLPGATNWVQVSAKTDLPGGCTVRTAKESQAQMILLGDKTFVRLGPLTTVQLNRKQRGGVITKMLRGILFFFGRDRPGSFQLEGPEVRAVIYGTEFVFEIAPNDTTTLWLYDGKVDLGGGLVLTNGDVAITRPGQRPERTSSITTTNLDAIQWCLYYPAVLDLNELALAPTETTALQASLTDYRSGDLLSAWANYPTNRVPASSGEKVYYAALLLSLGSVAESEAILSQLPAGEQERLARALRQLIAAVKLQRGQNLIPANETNLLASEWLAVSYSQQASGQLAAARDAARRAVQRSPNFGFGWARLAELEFGFGNASLAREALAKAVALAPRNVQAQILRGFVLCAKNRLDEARQAFEQALALDRGLGNAWLGRGLCRIRQGDLKGGRQDLEMAAAAEPQRALLRSYLAKAFAQEGQNVQAEHELGLAKARDPLDPTAWLYSALLKENENLFNAAIADLEKSKELNDNRDLYRSRLMLDQDRAVRSANLAALYQQAGMPEVAVREAAQAVNADYANPSAHLFLAESFDALRDPTRFNLRYETVWFNEWLLANLLAPVGGGSLSQHISQQEYSRMFEANGVGLSSYSDYRSDGLFHEVASQFGTVGSTSYALDLDSQFNQGVRPNNGLSRIEWYSTVKEQLTPQDTALLMTKYQDYHSGDNFQYYDPASARVAYKFDEIQDPLLFLGYHREWAPGIHTLFWGGRLINDQHVTDQNASQALLFKNAAGQVGDVGSVGLDLDYRSQFEIYSTELNQIFEGERHTLVLGGRYQTGQFTTSSRLFNPQIAGLFNTPAQDLTAQGDFQQGSLYGYYTLVLPANLHLTGGAAVEHLRYPENFRSPPVTAGETSRDKLSPKAAAVWSPLPEVTARGSYTRSLGGVSFEGSTRLEPTQLAGFTQSFRNLIPESVVGAISAPALETWGAALDLRLKTHTYLGIEGESLGAKLDQAVGVFDYRNLTPPAVPSSTQNLIDYRERAVAATVNQLLSKEWSLGTKYRFARASFDSAYPQIPVAGVSRNDRADLHEFDVLVLFNHPSGFFAEAESQWCWQNSGGTDSSLRGDAFAQVNLFCGYRFARRRAEVTIGVMNLGDRDYRLNPLNIYAELPRERAFVARLLLNF